MWFNAETRDETIYFCNSLYTPSALREGKSLYPWTQFVWLLWPSQENQRFFHCNGYTERPSAQPSAHRLRSLLLTSSLCPEKQGCL